MNALLLSEKDNVLTCTSAVKKGGVLDYPGGTRELFDNLQVSNNFHLKTQFHSPQGEKLQDLRDSRPGCLSNPIIALTDIPVYHKVANTFIGAGEKVYKYGEPIGVAGVDIRPGEHVHVHNVEGTRGRGDKKEA